MTGFDNLCMNCMFDTAGKTECPNCSFSSAEPQMSHALPYRTELQDRYIVGRAKQNNGEGVTYIGYDTVLKTPIELREFFPQTLCERADNRTDIRVNSGSEVIFNECLAGFLSYSREVAHMRELSAIVQIYDIFEENHTAYTVSEWNESITLRYFVERSGGSLSWNAARQLFMPVLSALSAIHTAGICHLGISPDTLHIMKDGKMKLGGFCTGAVRRMDTDLPPDLVAGCSAIEQYVMDFVPNEATDVYGFAASLFFALTGTMPNDALKRRMDSRLLIPTSILRGLPPHVVTAVANALQVSPDKRTPTFERLRAELSAAPTVTATLDVTQRLDSHDYNSDDGKKKKEVPNFVWVLASCVIALIVFTSAGILWIFNSSAAGTAAPLAKSAQTDSEENAEASLLMSVESADPNLIAAPNLIGQNYNDLVNSAPSESSQNQDFLLLLSTKQFSDTVPEGCIISQSPPAETKIAKGTEIVVVVSKGAEMRTLPSIKGKSLSDASEAAASAGFVPTKTEEYSDTVPAGYAIGYQKLKEGSQLAYGSQVVIIISKGPQPVSSAAPESSSASSVASSNG